MVELMMSNIANDLCMIREIDHGTLLLFLFLQMLWGIQYTYLKRDVKSHQAERQGPWNSYEVHCN